MRGNPGAAILLGLSPLVQTQFALVTALFCGLVLLFGCISERYRAGNRRPALTAAEVDLGLLAGVSFVLASPTLLLLAHKASLMTLVYGWNVPARKHAGALSSVASSAGMWVTNAWQWFLAVGIVCWRQRRIRVLLAMLILFLAANVVQFAVWEWDQIKIFIALYILFIAVWAGGASTSRRT